MRNLLKYPVILAAMLSLLSPLVSYAGNTEDLLNYVKAGEISGVMDILKQGVNVNAKDNTGWTALHWAALSGNAEIVRLLIESGADVNLKDDKDGRTALIWAIWQRKVEINEGVIRILLEGGADVNLKDKGGRTPLIWAAIRGHVDVLGLLLEKGADVDIKDNDGLTALSHAKENDSGAKVELLLKYGAKQ